MVLPYRPLKPNDILRTLCIALALISRRRINAVGPRHRDTMNISTFS